MSSDLTFVTNEANRTLLERFQVLIRDTRQFDVLVGYFFTSGFYALHKSLETTERIRILIGIGTGRQTTTLIQAAAEQTSLPLSHADTTARFGDTVVQEMSASADTREIEEGVHRFMDWIRDGKLDIRAYPTEQLHAKVYIMTFAEGDRDVGRVITGSSNFTQSGLVENLEFNVELKTRADYDYAKEKFEALWNDAVGVSDKYVQTIQANTWLNDTITPRELYLKFLYEYFKDELTQAEDVFVKYLPPSFKRLEYQEQAVLNAKKILGEYGGVFISDVVGLGKTYMAAMLANQLDGRTLVIAPPMLLEPSNPGSWPNVFSDFRVAADFESLGKLESLVERGTEKYKNVIIDEAHRFRTETTMTYETLAQVCRGKRVILVTATPFNNSPKDLLSQIKLFQKSRKSTIPGLPDLESFFSKLQTRLAKLDRKEDQTEYLAAVRENARDIRDKVLKYLMVRRTRREIERHFPDDLSKQGLRFPEVADPEAAYYELNPDEDRIFNETVQLIARDFKYSRYTPMLYYKGAVSQPEELGQRNMGRFMKILLVKRLESSFHAFRNTIDRFIRSYDMFLEQYARGAVWVSKEYTSKIFELLEDDDEERVLKLVEEAKAHRYDTTSFDPSFKSDLEHDLAILRKIRDIWGAVKRDPKLLKFIELLSNRKVLRESRLVVFTESKETAEYLQHALSEKFPGAVLTFTGSSSEVVREKVIANYDARARHPRDDHRILVTTEVLAEGVNLHRSNVVVNYDIPWNPTRLMQRVGRINRVDTAFDKIYTFNFFPTKQSNDQIKLKEAAEAKIHAFISLLGADGRLLTEGEPIEHHELFDRLTSRKTITGEDEEEESGLKYLQVIRDIRDNDPDLFASIKRLPKKARTGRRHDDHARALLTYFRKGRLQKFFLAGSTGSQELDFLSAAKLLESTETKRQKLGADFYQFLDQNKDAFAAATLEDAPELRLKGGRDTNTQLLKVLRAVRDTRQLTEEQEQYLQRVTTQLEEGGIPKQTAKAALKGVESVLKDGLNPRKVVAALHASIPDELLAEHFAGSTAQVAGPREVILSEYFAAD